MQPRYPANKDVDAAFDARLESSAKAIIAEAQGRTCGGCHGARLASDGQGVCVIKVNVMGEALRIYKPSAYACKDWRAEAA